jgi:hypothetical protein
MAQAEMEHIGRAIFMDFLFRLRNGSSALRIARTFIAFGGEG